MKILKAKKILFRIFARKQFQPIFETMFRLGAYGLNHGSASILPLDKTGELVALKDALKICYPKKGENTLRIYDVGAQFGHWSLEVAKILSDRRKMIYAFEPTNYAYEILQRNTCRVDCIIPQKCGLSNAAGTALIYFPFEGCGGTSIYSRLPEFMNHSVTSEKIILDTLAKHAGEQCVDVLKIDVEGHEMAVLEGAGKKLSEIGIIQFEFGESQLNSKNSFRDFWDVLKEFRVFRCVVDGLYLIPKYSHWLERYGTSNFIAINKKFF